MTDKITSPAPARADIGAEMANVMFNFAQRAGHTLTSDDAVLFDKLRKRWDAAPAQAPVAADAYPVAWRWMPSKVWGEWCITVDGDRAATAASNGFPVEPLYTTAPQAPAAAERNQCDGCCAGMPLDGGLHRDDAGRAVQACQADRYAAPQAPQQVALDPVLKMSENEGNPLIHKESVAVLVPALHTRPMQWVFESIEAGNYSSYQEAWRDLLTSGGASPAPGMTQPKTEEPVRYCWSHDGEEYHDELPSREDAMHEALAALVTDGVGEPGDIWTVHTGVCRPAISILRSIAESIGSELVERLEEWLCDDITSDHPIIELPKGRHADLGNAVLDFMAQHAEFKRYGVGEEQEHEEEIPGDADSSVQVTGKEGDA